MHNEVSLFHILFHYLIPRLFRSSSLHTYFLELFLPYTLLIKGVLNLNFRPFSFELNKK